MNPLTTYLTIATLLTMHACVTNADLHFAEPLKQLRSSDDMLGSIVPDTMILGSVHGKNRLVAVSTVDDDSALMTNTAKTTSRARSDETEALLGDHVPTKGSSAMLMKNTLFARSDADSDRATLTKTSTTLVRAEEPDATRKNA